MDRRPWDLEAYSARIPLLARFFGRRVWSQDSGYWVEGILWDGVLYVTDNGSTEDEDGGATP